MVDGLIKMLSNFVVISSKEIIIFRQGSYKEQNFRFYALVDFLVVFFLRNIAFHTLKLIVNTRGCILQSLKKLKDIKFKYYPSNN